MRFGKPIVSTEIPGSGTGWVNQNNVTGFTVPPMDEKALALALDRIIAEPQSMVRFGKNAKERFIKEFDIKITARTISKLYEEIYS